MARILIIDDDPVFSELTARRLASGGHTVDVRDGPTGVLTDVREVGYDLLLVDVNMPGISGPRLVDALASRDRGRMKLVFISSIDGAELETLSQRHGADGWISKSANRAEVLTKVGLLLIKSAEPKREEEKE